MSKSVTVHALPRNQRRKKNPLCKTRKRGNVQTKDLKSKGDFTMDPAIL